MIQKQKTLVSREGEKLTDSEVDQIFKLTGTEEDIEGNIKYEGPELFLCSTSTSLLASLVAIVHVFTWVLGPNRGMHFPRICTASADQLQPNLVENIWPQWKHTCTFWKFAVSSNTLLTFVLQTDINSAVFSRPY